MLDATNWRKGIQKLIAEIEKEPDKMLEWCENHRCTNDPCAECEEMEENFL